jgi:environmental stress-induced protein Ves
VIEHHIIRFEELAASPWKNGGGVTREVIRFPRSSDLHDFHLRISIADVHSSGPFSLFPDHDRMIIQLTGLPMTLRSASLDSPIHLSVNQPFYFSGATNIHCDIESPTTDYNLMVHKRFLHASTEILAPSEVTIQRSVSAQEIAVIFALRDTVDIEFAGRPFATLRQWDSIWLNNAGSSDVSLSLSLSNRSSAVLHVVTKRPPIDERRNHK